MADIPSKPAPPTQGGAGGCLPIDVIAVEGSAEAVSPVVEQKPFTLTELSKDFTFFTTGCVHRFSRLDKDPIEEFLRKHPGLPHDLAPVTLVNAAGFFQGLGVAEVFHGPCDFDRTLFAVPHETWLSLEQFIGSIEVMDAAERYYCRVFCYATRLADSFELAKPQVVTEVPYVDLHVFGVAAVDGTYYLNEVLPPHKPRPVKGPSLSVVLQRAAAVFSQNMSIRKDNVVTHNPDAADRGGS